MKRGEIYDARLDPTEGSEQGGTRPIIIVSRNVLNVNSTIVLAVPCTTYRPGKRVYPTHVLIQASEGGLDRDSIALAEQIRVLAKTRLLRLRGELSEATLVKLDRALLIALDLPGQS
ncbi:MAG: type II toxin-antitoxin system PemK/MazF family toxin [Cyanobacteria bacterium CRU_2_1]|nr:type II toxin-antitoxin system PemK/MazF family toxin [Cyanobacteria bacterium RU_5_0]NJR58481.1 type II toxin-antitoxin system PemK/MazF family toxin [Cyanobacteria bacterium CRU_2_1]NJR58521.1 type II toxin-antitoxin system PemK/MazF family toxin [Cyanobacteria bacterium CRU_2_1]